MPENVTARREQQVIPTYIPKEPNAMPMFFEKKPYQGGIRQTLPPALFRRHHRRKEGCILRGLHSGKRIYSDAGSACHRRQDPLRL